MTANPGDQQEDPESAPPHPAVQHAGTAWQVQTKQKHGAWKISVFRSVPLGHHTANVSEKFDEGRGQATL